MRCDCQIAEDMGTGEAPSPVSFPSTYKPKCKLEPTDLDDLCRRVGKYADAAKAHVEWGAITQWLMCGGRRYDDAIASAGIEGRTASQCVLIVREADEHKAGWPRLSGKPVKPVLYDLNPIHREETVRIAKKIRALWEAAGRPNLNGRRCTEAYRDLFKAAELGLADLPVADASAARSRKAAYPPAYIQLEQFFKEQVN